jgi:nitrogen fixation-related uncharacterized protein
VSSLLLIVSVAVVGVVVAIAALWYRATQADDLGSVSHVWIAELRAGDPYDSSR